MTAEPDIQYFSVNGTWTRPDGAVAVDVLVQAAGGGSSVYGGLAHAAGATGGIQVKRFTAPDIPPTVDIEVGKGGRPGGRDGYVVVVTHMGDGPRPVLHELLDSLPRVKITPATITQPIIDGWYRREREYRAQIERLAAMRNTERPG